MTPNGRYQPRVSGLLGGRRASHGAVTTLSTEESAMMTDWYQKSINTLQLNGKAERTQEAYTRPCGC